MRHKYIRFTTNSRLNLKYTPRTREQNYSAISKAYGHRDRDLGRYTQLLVMFKPIKNEISCGFHRER